MVSKFKLDTSHNNGAKEVITRTMQIANTYAGELSIEVLPLENIELDPDNNRELVLTLHDALNGINQDDPEYARKRQDWKSLESLAKTIIDDQLINPVFVYRYGNKCRLIAGERRTLASAIAGKKEIIARIASQRPVGTKLRILQWIENNERVDLTLAERISSLEAIIKEYFTEKKEKSEKEKMTGKLLSDLTGMSMTQARRYILVLHSSLEIKQAISEGKLENIKLIELILSAGDLKNQQILLKAALSGFSFEALSKLKNEIETTTRKKINIGRKQLSVNLGQVKPNVAKIIFDALLASAKLKDNVISQLNSLGEGIQWADAKSVQQSFQKILLLISAEA